MVDTGIVRAHAAMRQSGTAGTLCSRAVVRVRELRSLNCPRNQETRSTGGLAGLLLCELLVEEAPAIMRVAVPLFENEVAPRFCFAREMLVATVDDGQVVSRERLLVESLAWPERIRWLEELGVTVILASGFDRCQAPMARARGIQVIFGLGGSADALLEAYCAGEIGPGAAEWPASPPQPAGPRGRENGR